MYANKILEGNWNELKGKVKQKWGKLSSNDLDEIDGSYDVMVGKIQQAYGHTKREVEKNIGEFIEGLDHNAIPHSYNDFKDKIYQGAMHAKDKLEKVMHDTSNHAQHAQENVINYIRDNPIKSLAIAVLTGIITTKILSKD